ncbi:MAG: apolipoprotein N-acyltransferase [Mariprofundales bacterium]
MSYPVSYRLPIALLAGAAMPFAFAPYHWWPLALLALAVWIALLAPAQAAQAAAPFRLSFAFGLGWFAIGSWWLAPTFHHYGNLPWIAAIAFQLLIGAVLALFPALLGWSAARLSNNKPLLLMLLFAPLTLLEEWVRGHIFTGLPWIELGNLMLGTAWIGWGSVVGGLGLSLLPPLLAAGLWGATQPHLRRSAIAILLVGAALAVTAPTIVIPQQPQLRVALIQPNIAQDQKWDRNFLVTTMHRLRDLSAATASQVDLIVWPEAATPFFLAHAPGWQRWLTTQVTSWRTPLLFGGLKQRDDSSAANGAWLLGQQSSTPLFVGKHHLVPFGEYVPDWIPWLHKLVPDIGDFRPSHDSGVLTLSDSVRIGVLICYESIFADEMRARIRHGANILAVLTNDAWYDRSPAAWQHLQAAQMRAVEGNRFVLRAANTGITASIAPDGTIHHTMGWWQQGAVITTAIPINAISPYCRYGDWPMLLLALGCIALLRWRFSH